MDKNPANQSGVLFLPQSVWLRTGGEISTTNYDPGRSQWRVGRANSRTSESSPMKNFNSNTTNKDEWLTPPQILKAVGPFDLDPCAPIDRPWPMAKIHYTKNDDGLSKLWHGRVWLNPPYGAKTFAWLERLAKHGSGLALIFARTETRGFHAQIWDKADALFFFRGRLCFHYVTGEKGGTANAPSCLVSYSQDDTFTLERTWKDGLIQGKLVRLTK